MNDRYRGFLRVTTCREAEQLQLLHCVDAFVQLSSGGWVPSRL